MDEKRERCQMLLIYVAIGIIAAVIAGWFLYRNRMKYWKSQACSTFRVALEKELQKKRGIGVYYAFSGNINLADDSIDIKKKTIKVQVESEYGKKDFFVPYEKYAHNVEKSSILRGMHSYILHVSPLKADSLNMVWKERLLEMGFAGNTMVRISVANWDEHETCTFSGDSLCVAKSDSLVSCYLGYRCEVGVTGYMDYPWLKTLTVKNWLLLCGIVLAFFLLFFIHEYVAELYSRFFVKKIGADIEEEVPAVKEAEHSVLSMNKEQTHVYRLGNGLCFDADSRVLKNASDSVKLMPLSAKLLQGFLDAKDFKLSNDEIMHLLWNNNTATLGKLHTNINRLRGYLSQFPGCEIYNENFSYQLRMSPSIEKFPV